MAVEDASFNTVIVSISDGDTSEILLTGKPSTIYNGLLSCDSDVPPRTRILISASGDPSVEVTCTPAKRPVSVSATVATGIFFKSSPPTDTIDPVKSAFLAVP